MTDRRRIRPEGGFILAEVLATLAISGLVVLTLATGVGMLIQSWERTSGRFNRMEALIRAMAVLRRDLQGLQFATWTPEEEPELIFSGTVDTIAFVPGRNVAAPTPADYVVRVQALKRGGRNLIVRTSAPYLPSQGNQQDLDFANPVMLVRGPWVYRFAYAGIGRERGVWFDTWNRKGRLPSAIRMEVLDRTAERHVVPPMVVSLKVTAPPDCRIGQQTRCGREKEEEENDGDGGTEGNEGGGDDR